MMLIPFSLSLIVFSGWVDSFCYWIDGTDASQYSPCYALNSVGASMCCDAPDGFDCLSSGICRSTPYGPLGPYDNGSSYWRAGCSDDTWQDGACLAMAPWITNTIAQLSLCADGSFCPRDQNGPNTTCCENDQGQQATLLGATIPASAVSSIQAALTATSSTTSAAPSTSSSSTVSGAQSKSSPSTVSVAPPTSAPASSTTTNSAPASTSTSSPNPSPPQSSNKAWIAGAVIGPVFAIALAIGTILLIRRRRQPKSLNWIPATYEKPEMHAECVQPKELEAPDIKELPAPEFGSVAHAIEMQ